MKNVTNVLASGLMALAASQSATALAAMKAPTPPNDCFWISSPGIKEFRRDIGTLYVARDARIGSVIGTADVNARSTDLAGLEAACSNDGTALLEFNAVATAPIFPGIVDPINGEDVTGKIIQTNIPGVGIRVKLGYPYMAPAVCANCFVPVDGNPTVPYLGINDHQKMLTSLPITYLNNRVTLIKTGPIPSGPQVLNGSELWSGSVTTLGRIMRYGVVGTVIQAQCSVGANPVSADPVKLGDWDTTDFTGQGFTTPPVPFSISLSHCETDTSAGFVATAHIQLDGVNGSTPVGPPQSGVFSLTSDSDAQGLGIQILKADAVTPMELQTEVPLAAITPGNTVLNFNARFYQTGPSSAIRPGRAKGALSFTMTYK
ncbi:type 1 fimbrial protein [Pseudomonas sp. DOAB1067]|uniref:Type 1 fimbrial protein n=2 Tax=Pseudomonas triticifolii TaxID=2762592 RepID=A0ABR7BAM0_9PSED|nr:fimbrial protein [Pseudomonas triticifolii]MBC3954226.1 type 1 fimbrial protein [Pseudomonas triticifolii]